MFMNCVYLSKKQHLVSLIFDTVFFVFISFVLLWYLWILSFYQHWALFAFLSIVALGVKFGYLFEFFLVTWGKILFYFIFPFTFISWRLITLQYWSAFCHTLTWISHGFTCLPHPNPRSHLPLHPIPLGLPSAPALSTCLIHPTWAGYLFHPW